MGIQLDTSRTDAYVGTFEKNNEEDMRQLAVVRKIVSNMNKDLRSWGTNNYQFYVKCQGRGHRRGVRRYNSSLPLSFADKMDAYIYRR